MTHVAIRTNAGAAHDHAVRNGTASPSPVREIALFDSEPLPSIEAAKAISALPDGKRASFVRRTESDCDFTKIDDSATATIYSCLITADVEFNARSFVIILENGIIWGYGVIYPERGGFYKYSGVQWELKIAILDNDNTTSTFTYSPIDVALLRKNVLEGIGADFLAETLKALCNTNRLIVENIFKGN